MNKKQWFKYLSRPFLVVALTLCVATNVSASGSGEKREGVQYKNSMPAGISLPATTFQESLRDFFLSKKSGLATSQASSVSSTDTFEGCDDETVALDGVNINRVATAIADCPSTNPEITRKFTKYDCASGQQLTGRETITYRSVLSALSASSMLEDLREAPALANLTLKDVQDRLAGKCFATNRKSEQFTYQCIGGYLRPRIAVEVTTSYSLAGGLGSGFGDPSSITVRADNATWDETYKTLVEREYESSKHDVTFRPDSDPKKAECSDLKVGFGKEVTFKKHFHTVEYCDKKHPTDNTLCFSTDPNDIKNSQCVTLQPAKQWKYQYGVEGADDWHYVRDLNLIVSDFFKNCSLDKRYWAGDSPAQVGTANGVPIYWSTTEWFHTRIWGTYLWDQSPVDANWNGLYIIAPSNLPAQTPAP